MSRFINSVFLVSGMAIGSGLISLPISAAKLGINWTILITIATFFVAYKTSCLTVGLMRQRGRSLSIVELSNEISGPIARSISMISLYLLSLALLCAYFAGTSSIIESFFSLNAMTSALICALIFSILFLIRSKIFNKINSVMVFVLLGLITCVILSINSEVGKNLTQSDVSALIPFLPIIFTSFGVQNACPYVVSQMGLDDIKAIKKVFCVGILIPAIVYVLWIYATLSGIYNFDVDMYYKILAGNVDAGTLVKTLCDSVSFKSEAILLKLLSLFAILTSAAGTGIGLISSLRETVIGKRKSLIALITVGIPVIATLFIPNAFIRILSFGGMIATIFVIFMPIYLNSKNKKIKISSIFCIIFGIMVIISELFM